MGGAASKLENLVGAYTAFANDGMAATPLYLQEQKAQPRRLMSPGAAWVIRDMLANNPANVEGSPLAGAVNRHAAVAWKTGTSYGYRDAWALGVTDNFTIGVWIGRPDGTPSPGQYGAVTALPLLFQITDFLPNRGPHARTPQPATVRAVDICWPLGGSVDATPAALCRQRHRAWTVDGALPPTFAERDLGAWASGLVNVRVDDKGRRLSATCSAKREQIKTLARWPALAAPWLSEDDLAQSALPPLAPGCPADSLATANPIRIAGISNGATLRQAPNSDKPLRVSLQALGPKGTVQWLLNGRLLGSSEGSAPIAIALDQVGVNRLTALTHDGAFATLAVTVF